MKCVKNLTTNEVKRVSDKSAEFITNRQGTPVWQYVPKSEWKALRVAPVEAIVHTDEQKQEISRRADKRKQEKVKKTPIKKYMQN